MIKYKNFLIKGICIVLSTGVFTHAYAGAQAKQSMVIKPNKSQTATENLSTNTNNQSGEVQSDTEDKKDILSVSSAWARPSMSSTANSAVYLNIKNNTTNTYSLIGASAMTIANNVELHQSYVDEQGVSKMTSIDKILIPALTTVELKPAGMHIMLFDLKRALRPGDKFDINLFFEGIGKQTVEVDVKE